MRALRLLACVLAAVLLTTCAPPPKSPPTGGDGADAAGEPVPGPTAPPVRPAVAANTDGGAATAVPAAGDVLGGNPTGGTVREDPVAAHPTAVPIKVTYARLAGGVLVPRCPACGEVVAAGDTQCAGCGQSIVAWGQESLCVDCAGSGACGRCGDDRPCLACDGDGLCFRCGGRGRLLGAPCPDCDGRGRCADCGGDGRRESVRRDFRIDETFLPGICPTCFDGSGVCPDCGATGKDVAGGECLTCGGYGLCPDCGGSGQCVHDRGDGLCAVCGGGGREVFNGTPPLPSARRWTLRRADGTPIVGRLTQRPSPNILVRIEDGGDGRLEGLMPGKVHPISHYMALRDFTPLDSASGRLELANVALQRGLLPLAEQEFRRAAAADRSLAVQVAAQMREIEARRVARWLELAEEALGSGLRERGSLLLDMVRMRAQGDEIASKAAGLLARVRREAEAEVASLDRAARERRERETTGRVARTVERARARFDRARRLLRIGRDAATAPAGAVAAFEGADRAAWSAARLVAADAHRAPATQIKWAEPPDALLGEARILRSEIALARAVSDVGGGRFRTGARHARRAMALDVANAEARKILEEAERGIARMGVVFGSPPPRKPDTGDK